ncbi:histidine acid phosphatase [Diplodia corticola]|uniref:Histidine acid phosphatase n=1 Tax=Diplodia corticola TaxID=236234 RepID=A0A1J9RYF6_9PEZI|nr:histidine acid phosphatase [Diplodia corticola]OJD37699.1 histidine acid phosphatase [Diplodia corticola]
MGVCAASFLTAAFLASAPLTVSAAVHAAVIFTRTGERTPLLGQPGLAELTPLGARQAYSQGTIFRQRYIAPQANSVDLGGPDAIRNISEYDVVNSQLYVLATDATYAAATAQAFLQGLYPPHTLNDTATPALAATAVLANGTYVEAPLNGYQYPRIRTASSLDPASVYLAGQEVCLNYVFDRASYFDTLEFNETQARTSSFYSGVGAATSDGVLPEVAYSYVNAYAIYDYLSYQYMHNVSTRAILSNNITLPNAFDELRYLADQQQWAFNSMPNSSQWIRAVAGKMLARKILGQLAVNIATQGANAKLSLLFGEFQPMLSLFSLALQQRSNSSHSYGIPEFASSMAFELFSYGTATESYPATSDLWVRFYFRNGTSNSSELIAYPIFGHGPSETAMRWSEFETSMGDIMLDDVGEWCAACDAAAIFCPALVGSPAALASGSSGSSMPPAVAGVVGAGTAMGVGLLAVAALMLLGGLRFHRAAPVIGAGRRRKSSLGGFKSNAKLASDADVSFASKGAPLGVSVAEQQQQQSGLARERVGSWEMDGARVEHLSGSAGGAPGDWKGDWKGDDSRRSSVDIHESTVARPHSRL